MGVGHSVNWISQGSAEGSTSGCGGGGRTQGEREDGCSVGRGGAFGEGVAGADGAGAGFAVCEGVDAAR